MKWSRETNCSMPRAKKLAMAKASRLRRRRRQRRRASNRSAALANPAPARALEVINQSLARFGRRIARARNSMRSSNSAKPRSTRNLIRNFFLAEKYRKGTSKAPAEKVAHAAVIGAGVMGSGIAQWLSSRGVTRDPARRQREQIDRGLANIDKTYGGSGQAGLDERGESEGRSRAHRRFDQSRSECATCRSSSKPLRKRWKSRSRSFAISLRKIADKTILATNTSALPISELGGRPRDSRGGSSGCIFSIRSAA